jgi:hypothetical protein
MKKGRIVNFGARRFVTTSVVYNVCALGQVWRCAPKRAPLYSRPPNARIVAQFIAGISVPHVGNVT